eukprot:m.110718 g.110718  ORF g.110718 m.110718 type:complete len:640 (+) comp37413_c0_seq4:4845-6764(+)
MKRADVEMAVVMRLLAFTALMAGCFCIKATTKYSADVCTWNDGGKVAVYKKDEIIMLASDTECICKPPNLECYEKAQNIDEATTDERIEDPCSSSPCQNGGVCEPLEDGDFRCVCSSTRTGKKCESCIPAVVSVQSRYVFEPLRDRVKIPCDFKNANEVLWSPLKNERFFINKEGKLVIHKPRHGDSGSYTCMVINDCGIEASATTELVFTEYVEETAPSMVECPDLVVPSSVSIKPEDYSRAVRSVVKFRCLDNSHDMYGPNRVKCLESGSWSDDPPVCNEPPQCPSPEDPPYCQVAKRKSVYRPGDRVMYLCKNGYANLGHVYQKCGSNLRWIGPGPNCVKAGKSGVKMSCGNPGILENGFQSDESAFSAGSFVQYGCNAGYFLRGPRAIQCGKNGRWSSSPPVCFSVLVDQRVFQDYIKVPEPPCCADLAFVLDSSLSVTDQDFLIAKQLVANLSKLFRKCDVRISLITYCKDAVLNFKGVSFKELDDHLARVRRCYGPTATRLAFDLVRDELLPDNRHCRKFCEPVPTEEYSSGEDRVFIYPCPCMVVEPDCLPCMSKLFFITDGMSNWAGDPCYGAKCLKDNGMEIYSIGVGAHVNVEELEKMASERKGEHVFLAKSYAKSYRLFRGLKPRSYL